MFLSVYDCGMSTAAMHIVDRPEQAVSLMDTTRLRLLHELGEPDSASGLARRVAMPRQRVNYHLRELEKAGLVEFVREQRKGNCTERIVRAVARHFVINPAVVGGGDAAKVEPDALSSAYLIAAASRLVADVATLRARAAAAGKPLSTITGEFEVAFGSAADRAAFAEDLLGEVARLVAEYHDPDEPGASPHRFLVVGYPTITPNF